MNQTSTLLRVIITGATGMVGEGVLHECMEAAEVAEVLLLNRRPSGIQHPKITEVVHADLFDLTAVENQLIGYNACFFCLGMSSVGVSKEEYYKTTYELTIKVATTLSRLNGNMTFSYISGAGTNSSEQGGSNWSRVKGKTENDLKLLPFKQVYNFRPGFMLPTPGLKNTLNFYKYINWLYPVLRPLFPGAFGTLKELGQGMINATAYGYPKQTLEVKDIRAAAERKP
ncbi:NAD-dependent epimerase/dehydratase family protein [Mucilaginibacter sp. PAMB04168]|uniref:NAD-dependent epimerase/dehydratase family protein n=1 Tax=Mucilaginibacter sp. PAMB04168 TaxID=3138567 RepID=UPI0031F62A5C